MHARILAQTYTAELRDYMTLVYSEATIVRLSVPPDVVPMAASPGAAVPPVVEGVRSVAEVQAHVREQASGALRAVYRIGDTLRDSHSPVVAGLGILSVYERAVRDEERQVEQLVDAYLTAMVAAVTSARYLRDVFPSNPQQQTRAALAALLFPKPNSVESYGAALKALPADVVQLEASLIGALAADEDALARRPAAKKAGGASGLELDELFNELQNACKTASDALSRRLSANYPALLVRALDASSAELTELVPPYTQQLLSVFGDLPGWLAQTLPAVASRKALGAALTGYASGKMRECDTLIDLYAKQAARLSQTVSDTLKTRTATVLLDTEAVRGSVVAMYAIFLPVLGAAAKQPKFASEQLVQEQVATLRRPSDATADTLRQIVAQLDDYLGGAGSFVRMFDANPALPLPAPGAGVAVPMLRP